MIIIKLSRPTVVTSSYSIEHSKSHKLMSLSEPETTVKLSSPFYILISVNISIYETFNGLKMLKGNNLVQRV